jgi:hypothetical protein
MMVEHIYVQIHSVAPIPIASAVVRRNPTQYTFYEVIMKTNQVTMEVPLALQQLIKTNNELLRTYQSRLLREIEDANTQLMSILKLDTSAGWRLDMENMVYIRVGGESIETTTVE